MATFHALEVRQESLSTAVTQEVTKYSKTLRNRLGEITDYKEHFYKAFDGFVENDLPKDDLYKKLEEQILGKKKKGPSAEELKAEEEKKNEPILPVVDVTKEDQLANKIAKAAAKKEIDMQQAVEDTIKQTSITQAELKREKLMKKDKRAGKSKKEIENEAAKRDAEALEEQKEVDANVKPVTPVTYRIGKEYDEQMSNMRKMDYQYEQLLAKAKVKALKQNDMRVFDDLHDKKMNKASIKAYLDAEKDKKTEYVNVAELNKEWEGQGLDNKEYAEFWKDVPGQRRALSVRRGSGKGSRQSSRSNQLTTPERQRRAVRELYLPEITKNTWVTRKEVDLSTLYEDPYFDLIKKPTQRRGFRTGKASMDARVQFGKIPGSEAVEEEPEDNVAEGAVTAADTSQQPTVDGVPQEQKPEDLANQTVADKAKMRDATEKAAGDVDAAEKFFEGDKPPPAKKQAKPENAGKISALERQVKSLQERLEITKQQNKVELQHSKQKAKDMYEQLIEQKLIACRKAYEEEFEVLAQQYEEFKGEIDSQRRKWSSVQSLVTTQETQISCMDNMIDNGGNDIKVAMSERRMTESIEGNSQVDLMNFVSEMNDNPDSVLPETVEAVREADQLLASPFNFYGFNISLGIEDQIDVANRSYIRFYKKKINDILMDKDAIQTELESNQRLLNTLRQAQERSTRKIQELEIREAKAIEKGKTLKKETERKVQRLAKEYVQVYKLLADKFAKYKEYVSFEFESHEMIREGLEKVIQRKENDIDELKEALSVPRQHYRYIENLEADEIIKQKNEIVADMANNMGVPEDKLLEVLYRAEAARKAKSEVNKAFAEDKKAQEELAATEDAESPDEKVGAEKSKDGDNKSSKKAGDMDAMGSQAKLQRDVSVRTIQSRATADTLEGSLMAPPFKFGMQKQYRLQEMDSRKGERKKAETTLKEGIIIGQSTTSLDNTKTVVKSPSVAQTSPKSTKK